MRFDPDVWPVFGIRITTPLVTLEPVTPELAFALGDVAAEGIHDPATMPFQFPWTDAEPLELRRSQLQFTCRCIADWRPESWRLAFAVRVDGELAGVQDIAATDFGVLRQVATGSWLGRRFQGRGIGTEMRAAVVHLAFAGLGAERALSGAWVDNPASQAVSTKLGYARIGTHWGVRRGEACEEALFGLERNTWAATRRDDIVIDGLGAAALAQFGVT